MYKNTNWLDKVVDAETQEVIQEGTDQSAANFNNMEDGITDASVAIAMLQLMTGDLKDRTVRHEVILSGSDSKTIPYPDGFNHDNCLIISIMTLNSFVDNTTGWSCGSDRLDSINIQLTKSNIKITNLNEDNLIIRYLLLRFK